MLSFSELKDITGGKIISYFKDSPIEHLLLDSRKIISPSTSIFFAIKGERHDGHKFINELYAKGVRQFIVEESVPGNLPECNILQVADSVKALQAIAGHHRRQFHFPIIGITGSNGKTIVKEWLSQLLAKDFNIVRSPKSYNSQVGVPLSVWQINAQHNLGIFEAGISKMEEMENLEKVIKPDIGILTNIGTAHDEGFSSHKEKVIEKLKLFKNSEILFYCADQKIIAEAIAESLAGKKTFSWSKLKPADLTVKEIHKSDNHSRIEIHYLNQQYQLNIPFADDASIENILHCISVMFYKNLSAPEIQTRLNSLNKVAMRLELKEGINGCFLVDDTYNNDLAGLKIAINFLEQQQRREEKTVILSDVLESGMAEDQLYREIAGLLREKGIKKIIGIGETISRNKKLFGDTSTFFQSTELFLSDLDPKDFSNEIILIKGARIFEFERIVARLQQKVHGTLLEVNLDALSHNLNFYKSKLKPRTKIMVMVKAFAYGSGSFEIANLLQFHRANYLAVAYADEGVALRENGISLPIMVMNPVAESFEKLFQYNLEPEIYSFKILNEFLEFLNSHEALSKAHIKLDTGMRRLGFEEKDLKGLLEKIGNERKIKVASVFTHLAGADDEIHNDYTILQLEKFSQMANAIEDKLGYPFIRHALNSAGIVRYPEWQMDMVRLGIGLYGVEANGLYQEQLQVVGTLKTIISQIKNVPIGESIGYSRKGRAEKATRIATIAIGYADGFSRRFSNGVGKVFINGKLCPIIGNVCMDMTMVDISETEAQEGDEVIVFGKELSISELSNNIGTIPYEILTSVGERVKRVFYTE